MLFPFHGGERRGPGKASLGPGPHPVTGAHSHRQALPGSPPGHLPGVAPRPPAASAAYPGVDDQVGPDVHLFQVGVPLLPVPLLHLVRLVQVAQGGLCDVHPAGQDPSQAAQPGREGGPTQGCTAARAGQPGAQPAPCPPPPTSSLIRLRPPSPANSPPSPVSGAQSRPGASPGDSSRLHPVGEGHIMGPHVVLPLAQPDDTTQHVPRVYAHTHADVHARGLPHLPGAEQEGHLTT